METREFIERMAAIEAEIREARESRHDRNNAINSVLSEIRVDQSEMEERFDRMHKDSADRMRVLEDILARVTQLLDGYHDKGGLVNQVGELAKAIEGMPHGTILERLTTAEHRQDRIESRQAVTDRKLYIATGFLIALQVLAALGAFPTLFAK